MGLKSYCLVWCSQWNNSDLLWRDEVLSFLLLKKILEIKDFIVWYNYHNCLELVAKWAKDNSRSVNQPNKQTMNWPKAEKPVPYQNIVFLFYFILWFVSILSANNLIFHLLIYYLCKIGIRPEDGRSLKPICLLQLCRIGATIYEWLDIAWLKNYYNFGFDHFHMSWRYTGLSGLADLILGNSGPFATADWILPDLTIQGSIKINAGLQTFKNTFYFSYATKMTRRIKGVTVPTSLAGTHPLLLIRVLQMCRWRYPAELPLPYKGYRYVIAPIFFSYFQIPNVRFYVSSIRQDKMLEITIFLVIRIVLIYFLQLLLLF